MGPFRRDLNRTYELGKLTFENQFRSWPDAQEDLADAYDDLLIPLRGCIDCVADGVKDCNKADAAIVKLQRVLGGAKYSD